MGNDLPEDGDELSIYLKRDITWIENITYRAHKFGNDDSNLNEIIIKLKEKWHGSDNKIPS